MDHMNTQKIALVHDWLVTDAGAEKVLRAFIEIFPDADIYSLVDFLDKTQRENILKGKNVHTTFIQKLPFAKKHFRNYLPLFPLAIEQFDLRKYDLVISSSWAVAKGIKTTNKQLHICYCHTPIRYAWDLYEEYIKDLKEPKKTFVKLTLAYLRRWDLKSLPRVDHFIANSHYVAKRIKKTYKRDATVIYPPVDTKNFFCQTHKEDFYLSASRLVAYKKTLLIVEAFNTMPEKKLVVIGEGEEYEKLKAIAKSNITLLGYKEKKELIAYMQKAKAFVYAALEDFGIVPLEALSCGTPVIAYGKGGTAESIQDKKSGIHFHEQSIQSICEAIEDFENFSFDPKELSKRAETFSTERFTKEIKDFLQALQ